MVANSLLRFLLTDDKSLSQYFAGEFVSFKDIERRMFLRAREQNRAIPDHYYRLAQEETFSGITSIAEILTTGIPGLAREYLELHDKRVHVVFNKQNEWQELVTYIPPLFLQSCFLYKSTHFSFEKKDTIGYYKEYILSNTKYTAIPSAKVPQLDYYVNSQEGLHDLHMHLNGALETDQVWQDYLSDPGGIHEDLKDAFKNSKVREQLEQESHLLNPPTYITLLRAAQKLRHYFFDYLFPTKESDKVYSKEIYLNRFLNNQSDYPGGYLHPFASLITSDSTYPHLLSVEGLMYILMLRAVEESENETLASFFHLYLLILGLTNRLLVQQVHQYGFEQFQKHTLNGLREKSEKVYLKRYFQIHGNDSRNIKFLEGRFSPKKTEKEMIVFIDAIWKGWEKMKIGIMKGEGGDKDPFTAPELKLIAHFIKLKDTEPDDFIRHKKLRYEVWAKAKVLSFLILRHETYRKRVVAVDAAASEFDAPPEVFAPAFRLMRRSGLTHFTYHAGEDFYHIISGLRAIYEAIVFCGLKNGDRVGHATAAGISVDLWSKEVGSEILMRQGEYLDNLVFSYHLIIKSKILELHALVPFIINRVNEVAYEIYRHPYPITTLEDAWLMRQCCPLHTLTERKEDIEIFQMFNEDEWSFITDKSFIVDRTNRENSVWKVYSAYHSKELRPRFEKIITVQTLDLFGVGGLETLQLALLDFMTKKEIVIETLPTSNVRISLNKNYSTYHLWNWMKWKNAGKSIPPVVVGTDDTGIFATNIYNEYANIYCFLLNDCDQSHSEVMEIIKRLDEDSHIYKFT